MMNPRPIMDAGPGLNFFSLNKERLLFQTLGPISIPETVKGEMLRKSKTDARFVAVDQVLGKVPEKLLKVLSDDETLELAKAVNRIAGKPLVERRRSGKDLGELMVISHAVVMAEAGVSVTVLIDDTGGQLLATKEKARLQRLKRKQPEVGELRLVKTESVLKAAAGGMYLPDRGAMRDLYQRLRSLDDGLAPIEQTGLLNLECWSKRSSGGH